MLLFSVSSSSSGSGSDIFYTSFVTSSILSREGTSSFSFSSSSPFSVYSLSFNCSWVSCSSSLVSGVVDSSFFSSYSASTSSATVFSSLFSVVSSTSFFSSTVFSTSVAAIALLLGSSSSFSSSCYKKIRLILVRNQGYLISYMFAQWLLGIFPLGFRSVKELV